MELSSVKETQLDISNDRVRNPFDAVIRDYDRARAKQHCRMTRQRRDFNTIHEQKAIAFYTDAITKIEAL